MKRVLLISPDTIKKKMTGPAIRYFNFAKELSKDLDVVLFIPNTESDIDFNQFKFRVIRGTASELKKEVNNVDSIVIQGIALRLYPFVKKAQKPIVVDIYDPLTLENLELRKNIAIKDRITYHETDLDIILEQLAIGDYFICANEKQKDYWLGMLAAINRVNPYTYLDNEKMDKLIGIVPFGLDNEEPVKTKQVLKGVWPGIEKEDKVLIWGGGIWNWFDPITLIEAINLVVKKRQDIKLFFMGIGHPNANIDISVAEKAIELCKKYGLYDKNVFFNDWVPYEERQNYLLEADIGVSTYYDNLETRFSFRTRILDYLWCELPMILTKGDYMADLAKREQLGLCYEEKNYKELSEIIVQLVDEGDLYRECKKNINKEKNIYRWEKCIEPLLMFCEKPSVAEDKKNKVNILYKNSYIRILKYFYIRLRYKIKRILANSILR
ncbi:glycosyltransferase [Clostridiaceae bacterium 35-E11]